MPCKINLSIKQEMLFKCHDAWFEARYIFSQDLLYLGKHHIHPNDTLKFMPH